MQERQRIASQTTATRLEQVSPSAGACMHSTAGILNLLHLQIRVLEESLRGYLDDRERWSQQQRQAAEQELADLRAKHEQEMRLEREGEQVRQLGTSSGACVMVLYHSNEMRNRT